MQVTLSPSSILGSKIGQFHSLLCIDKGYAFLHPLGCNVLSAATGRGQHV